MNAINTTKNILSKEGNKKLISHEQITNAGSF